MIDEAARARAADALIKAADDRAPIGPIIGTHPNLELADAYAIQRRQLSRCLEAGGRLVGHKVGLTSRAMQTALGVDQPDFGYLVDDMAVLEGSRLSRSTLCQPRVEPEVAFILERPLRGPRATVLDALNAIAWVVPTLEVIDSRIEDWRISILDTIADNASSARFVVGASLVALADVDVRLLGVSLRRNGEVVETGCSGAVLGNPLNAVVWLANALAAWDAGLEAGQLVMPGSCTSAVAAHAGDTFRADFDLLGHVSVRFT